MTIANTQFYVDCTGDGVATVYPFSFSASSDTITVLELLDDVWGVTTLPYSVSNQAVRFSVAPNAGLKFRILRETPNTQPTTLANNDGFFPKVVETALDWLGKQLQELRGTSVRVSRGDVAAPLPPKATLVNQFAIFDGNGDLNGAASGDLTTLLGSTAVAIVGGIVDDEVASQIPQKALPNISLVGVSGDGSDETSKFVGLPGPYNGEQKIVTVSAVPLTTVHDAWFRTPSPEGPTPLPIDVPADRDMLPVSRGVIMSHLAYYAWSENSGHTIDGDCWTFGHAQTGGHGDGDASLVISYRVNANSGLAFHELLWRPDTASPLGYNSAAGGAIGPTQFILVWAKSGTDVQNKRLFRRVRPSRFVCDNKITAITGRTDLTFLSADLPLTLPVGATFKFANGPATIGGITIDSSTDYIITQITNNYSRFQPVAGPFAAATSSETGGGFNRIVCYGSRFKEVRFTGDKSWGEALVDYAATSAVPLIVSPAQPPYPTGSGFKPTVDGNRGAGCIGFSMAPGSVPYIGRMGGLLSAGEAGDYAFFNAMRGMPSLPTSASQPTVHWFDAGGGANGWIGVTRPQSNSAGPRIWLSLDGFASEPMYRELPAGGGANSTNSSILIPDQGNGARLQWVSTTQRDPGVAFGNYDQLPFLLWDVSLPELIANMAAAPVRRIRVGWMDWRSHNGQASAGPNPNSVGALTYLPGYGGLCAFAAYQLGDASWRNVNFCGHQALLIDTTRLTGAQKRPSLPTPQKAYQDTDIAWFYNISMYVGPGDNGAVPEAVATKLIRYRRAFYDYTLGDYDTSTGVLTARDSCRIEFIFSFPANLDGAEVVCVLWDVGAGAEFAQQFGATPHPIAARRRAETASGEWAIVEGRVECFLDPGQQVGLYLSTGTVFTSGPTSTAARLSTLKIRRLG